MKNNTHLFVIKSTHDRVVAINVVYFWQRVQK